MSLGAKLLGKSGRLAAVLVEQAGNSWLAGARGAAEMARFFAYSHWAFHEASVGPALDAGLLVHAEAQKTLVAALRGEITVHELASTSAERIIAASRYERLVHSWGRELFGSARFAEETQIGEDDHFRLSYLPPARGTDTGVAMFHSGGVIPFGDRLFRLTQESNFFQPFLQAGVGVYAMELRADRKAARRGRLTMARLVTAIETLSSVALRHHRERHSTKLILEGYCGHGTQALAYVAARPRHADNTFSTLALFVAPVDGQKCDALATAVGATPAALRNLQLGWSNMWSGAIRGAVSELGLDLALRSVFQKTAMGYAVTGYTRREWANVRSAAELSPAQRRELAGAYWMSVANARRYPVPVDIVRFTNPLFSPGIGPDGDLGFSIDGRRLTLGSLASETNLRVVGFYGDRDPVVSEKTAHVLRKLLGDRYRHVVHADAGHVAYVLSPRLWDRTNARGFRPNPVDVLLSMASNAG
jgi:hypothetical protein